MEEHHRIEKAQIHRTVRQTRLHHGNLEFFLFADSNVNLVRIHISIRVELRQARRVLNDWRKNRKARGSSVRQKFRLDYRACFRAPEILRHIADSEIHSDAFREHHAKRAVCVVRKVHVKIRTAKRKVEIDVARAFRGFVQRGNHVNKKSRVVAHAKRDWKFQKILFFEPVVNPWNVVVRFKESFQIHRRLNSRLHYRSLRGKILFVEKFENIVVMIFSRRAQILVFNFRKHRANLRDRKRRLIRKLNDAAFLLQNLKRIINPMPRRNQSLRAASCLFRRERNLRDEKKRAKKKYFF